MKQPRIVWRPVVPSIARSNADASVPPTGLTQYNPHSFFDSTARSALLFAGVPSVEGATTPREDAIGLLQLAAEVEHALMVQYLYAAQSLSSTPARITSDVAVQEMGHLITVQNLLLALTGATNENIPALIHLGRDRLRRASDKYNPLRFTLEKISHLTLAKFVVVERPGEIVDPALRERVTKLEEEAASQGISVHPVHALYAAIRWLFQPTDEPLGEVYLSPAFGLRPGWHLGPPDFAKPEVIDRFASTKVEWHSVPSLIVESAHTAIEAIAAIDAVTAQGEGVPGSSDSHFAKFIRLLDMFEAGGMAVRPLPRTPFVGNQPPPEDPLPSKISHCYTLLWAQLFNLQYELMLVDIAWAISQPKPSASRGAMINLTMEEMSKIIQPLSNDLTKRPMGFDDPAIAGPTYGLANESMPATIEEFRRRFAQLLEQQSQLFKRIQLAPEFGTDTAGRLRLGTIERINTSRSPHLPHEA